MSKPVTIDLTMEDSLSESDQAVSSYTWCISSDEGTRYANLLCTMIQYMHNELSIVFVFFMYSMDVKVEPVYSDSEDEVSTVTSTTPVEDDDDYMDSTDIEIER